MQVEKIKGILDAIETESKLPSPSHANLARLTGMALKEMLDFMNVLCQGLMPLLVPKIIAEPTWPPETTTNNPTSATFTIDQQSAEMITE